MIYKTFSKYYSRHIQHEWVWCFLWEIYDDVVVTGCYPINLAVGRVQDVKDSLCILDQIRV